MIQREMTDDDHAGSSDVTNFDAPPTVVIDVDQEATPFLVVETEAPVGVEVNGTVPSSSQAGNLGNHIATNGQAQNNIGGRIDRRASVGHLGLLMPSICDLLGVTPSSKSMDNGLDGLKRLPLPSLPYYKHLNGNGKAMNGSRSETASERRIRLEEVAPTNTYLEGANTEAETQQTDDWRMPLDEFSSKKRGRNKADRGLPQSIRRYYKTQDELITAFEDLQLNAVNYEDTNADAARLLRQAELLACVTFFCNLGLLIAKTAAAAMTGSLAVISSLIDSAVDLLSGTLFWWSSRAIKKHDRYRYPQGRTRLEPIAIVILSVVMSLASVQMIRESVEKIIAYATNSNSHGPDFNIASTVICSLTIVTKLILFIVCKRLPNPTVQALAQDHRNDVISNTVALGCGYAAYLWWKYLDPIGAIAISIYIICNWAITGHNQIKMLTGHTARPDFLKKLTWIALNHHAKINNIDTVRAFHFGSNFLVEVDIVLPEDMTHREAHDIGESLQMKLERLPEVERAFVHLDYETEHAPWSEHKVV